MALPVRQQLSYWGIAAVVFLLTLWLLGDILLPFVMGAALAYLLDPVADRLEAMGMSRIFATITITTLAGFGIFAVSLLVFPLLIEQTNDLMRLAPTLFQNVQDFLSARFPSLMDETSTLRRTLAEIGEALSSQSAQLANQVLSSALGVINIVVLVVLVPVVTFYLLLDWDRIVANINALLPLDHAPVIRHLAGQIDGMLSAFIRGQSMVCLILGTFYAVALMLANLQFGLVVGAIAGLITFIPYVGALVGGVLAVGLAVFQFWGDWGWVALIAGIFFVGQFLEGNILTPNLVGNSVGLHPVWLIFALAVFGGLFGFVGMLVGVPVAAAIGVIARFGIDRYKTSRLYLGIEGRGDDE